MQSQSNTFKLQRLTKTVGIREVNQSQYQPKQTFKLAAINSITRGIKYNDLSYMSGVNLNKLRKQPEAGEDILYESAHSNLQGVRKNYDTVHKQKNLRDLSISKLKQQKNKLQISQKELKDRRETGSNQVKRLQQNLQNIKLLFCETDMQKKVLLNMRSRLKSDKIVYDQRKFDLEKQFRFLKKQKEVMGIDKNQIAQSDDRTMKVYKKFLNQLKAQQDQREAHLRSLQSMIEQRQRVNQLNQFRGRQMQEIAQRAMQDKNDSQKSWMKLYMTNKLVSRLLRNKMDKQMNKFFLVESAFKTIKIATGVSDAQTLVKKFLNKQSAYGDLLGKIAQNQKKIIVLKEESQVFRKQQKQLETEKQVIESTKKVSQDVENQLKKMSQIDHKQERSLIYRQKIRQWIGKTNKKLNLILGKHYPIHIDRNLKSISSAFIDFLKNLSAQLEIANKKQIKDEINMNIQNKALKKMVRVELSKEEEEEEEDTTINNNDETDLIATQRLEIIKSNQKYMRQIRRKYEQKKKIAAQSPSPKKKPEGQKAPVRKPQEGV